MTTAVASPDRRAASKIPFARLVAVEIRKMFNTRAGFWLMMTVAITATLATVGVIIFVDFDDLTFGLFGLVMGVPLGTLLPIIAILSVTSEWSQRSGLTTFTLSPHRGVVIAAKLVGSVIVGIAGTVLAFTIGAIGNIVVAYSTGRTPVWDMEWRFLAMIMLGFVLGQLIGFMLGVLIRNSPGAIVGYFVYAYILPVIFGILFEVTSWWRDIDPWVNFAAAQGVMFEGTLLSSEQWAHLGVTGTIWLIIPLAVGTWLVTRSEVK